MKKKFIWVILAIVLSAGIFLVTFFTTSLPFSAFGVLLNHLEIEINGLRGRVGERIEFASVRKKIPNGDIRIGDFRVSYCNLMDIAQKKIHIKKLRVGSFSCLRTKRVLDKKRETNLTDKIRNLLKDLNVSKIRSGSLRVDLLEIRNVVFSLCFRCPVYRISRVLIRNLEIPPGANRKGQMTLRAELPGWGVEVNQTGPSNLILKFIGILEKETAGVISEVLSLPHPVSQGEKIGISLEAGAPEFHFL